jgi:hypothetical protein
MNASLGEATRVNLAQSLREARRNITTADDGQILRILRMVDALEDRGSADDLIAPVRLRLASLGLPRPLRLKRLLFVPADRLITNARAYDPDETLLPRAALAPFSLLISAKLGEEAVRIDQALRGATSADLPIIERYGGELWPRAAACLRDAEAPPAWPQSGLPTSCFVPLAAGLAAVLRGAALLRASEADDHHLLTLLQGEAATPQGFAMLLAACLLQFPEAEAPRRAISWARKTGPALLNAVNRALATAMGRLTPNDKIGAAVSAQAANALQRDIALLDALENDPGAARQAATLRGELRKHCAQRLDATAAQNITAPLAQLAAATPPNEPVPASQLAAIEDSARNLRAFETEARRLGSGDGLDKVLAGSALNVISNPALSLVERARLVEILAGPDAAMALLSNG